MSMIPVIEVSHLSSAASFYATIAQPLGLQWLSCTNALHFGVPAFAAQPAEVVFTLFHSLQPKPSLLQFLAASPDAVNEFHKRALHAYPFSANLIQADGDGSIARITDFDGNVLEARYVRRPQAPAYSTTSSTSTTKEARRVLDWQRDVARSMSDDAESVAPRSPPRSSKERHSEGERHRNREPPSPRLVRRETVTKEHYEPSTSYEASPAPSQDAASTVGILSGMNQTLLGTILGAAAGAAVAYAMAKSTEEPPKEPVKEQPVSPRRVVTYHGSSSRAGSTTERDSDCERIAMPERSNTMPIGRRGDSPRYPAQYSITKGVSALGLDGGDEKGLAMEGGRRGSDSRASRQTTSQTAREREREIERLEREIEMLEDWENPLSILPPPSESVAKSENRDGYNERERERERDRDKDRERDRDRESRHGSGKAGRRSSPSKSARKSDEGRTTASRSGSGSKTEARSHTSTAPSEASTIKPTSSSSKSRPSKVSTVYSSSSNRRGSMDSDRERKSAASGPSARYVPLPESAACQSVVSSVSPSDSISCAGNSRRRDRDWDRESRRS